VVGMRRLLANPTRAPRVCRADGRPGHPGPRGGPRSEADGRHLRRVGRPLGVPPPQGRSVFETDLPQAPGKE